MNAVEKKGGATPSERFCGLEGDAERLRGRFSWLIGSFSKRVNFSFNGLCLYNPRGSDEKSQEKVSGGDCKDIYESPLSTTVSYLFLAGLMPSEAMWRTLYYEVILVL
jgi:hypothetical protein